MRKTRRVLAAILVLCILFANGSLAARADFSGEKMLRLPESLKTIEEEAFFGDTSLEEVVLPEGVEEIGARAFAQSGVSRIILPNSLRAIDNSAFDGTDGLLAGAEKGSYAYDWAREHGYLDEMEGVIASVTITPVKRFLFERDELWGYWDETREEWVEQRWSRLNCWPGDALVTVCFTDPAREPLSGTLDEVFDSLQAEFPELWMGWSSDESPENPWGPGEHTAQFFIGDFETDYTVTALENPITAITVPDVTRYLGGMTQRVFGYENDAGEWVETEYERLDANPASEQMTVVAGDRSFTGDLGEIERQLSKAFGADFSRFMHWESEETPEHPWTKPGDYQAWQYIGDVRGAYTVHVRENPIESVKVSDISRYIYERNTLNGYENEEGFWVEEEWSRVDCWPWDAEVTVRFRDGREPLSGRFYEFSDELTREYNVYWESDESPQNPWEPGKHMASFFVEGVRADYDVLVLNDPVEALTVDPAHNSIVRYDFETQERWGYPLPDGDWADEPWRGLFVWPGMDESLQLRAVVDGVEYSGTAEDISEQLRDAGCTVAFYWESDETPLAPWHAGETHTATLVLGGKRADFTVQVKENPVRDIRISPVQIILGDRMMTNYGYLNDEGIWIEEMYECVDAGPWDAQVEIVIGDETRSGRLHELFWEIEEDYGFDLNRYLYWENDDTPEHPWNTPDTYTAQARLGELRFAYTVTLIENPLTSLSVDEVYHTFGRAAYWDAETQSWERDDNPEYIDCNFDVLHATARKDGGEIRYDGDEGGFHAWMYDNFGCDPDLFYDFVSDENDFRAGGSYEAVLVLGREDRPLMTVPYQLTLIENPIDGIRIDPQVFLNTRRYESRSYTPDNGFWAPTAEAWQQLDVTPYIQVTLKDGSTMEGLAWNVLDAVNGRLAHPALHFYTLSGEKPWAPWYDGEHSAILVVGTSGYFYSFTVIDNPIEEVSVPDVTRAVNDLSDWTDYYDYTTDTWVEGGDRKPWRIECHPDSITIVLKEGFSFNGAQSATFTNTETRGCLGLAADALCEATGVCFELHWNSNEIPDARWQPGDRGDAWVDISELGSDGIFHYGVNVTESAMRVALLADGPVDDGGFNQASFEAARDFCEEKGLTFELASLEEDVEPGELLTLAADFGFNVLVVPGYFMASAIGNLADEYPDVRFIALDATAADLNLDAAELPENVFCASYREELAGFMAGYAAVKLGYTGLGFLGGMPVPGVLRYGAGFVQGADAAAAETGAQVSIRYAYANQFFPSPALTDAVRGWYGDGTQVVFACGGGICSSVAEAAAEADGKIIGVDVDQAADLNGLAQKDITLTSAVKGLGPSTAAALAAVYDGSFGAGEARLGIVSDDPAENYVGLAASTQFGAGFTEADYAALVAALNSGAKTVSDDTEVPVESLAHTATVSYIENLRA